MIVTVYDKTTRQPIGLIEEFTALIWTDRYNDIGDFKLIVEPSPKALSLLQMGNYISIPKSDRWMVIETLSIKTDRENGNSFTFTGRDLVSLFEHRQAPDNAAFGGGGAPPYTGYNINVPMLMYVDWAFDYSLDTDKIVSYIKWQNSTDTRITDIEVALSTEYRYGNSSKNILDLMYSVCDYYGGFGLKVIPDANRDFVVQVYLGTDRSYGQSVNSYVIFSPEFSNIENSEWIMSTRNQKSLLYVHSSDEPPPGYVVESEIGSAPTGIDRREAYHDATYISRYDESDNLKSGVTMTYELEEAGDAELLKRGIDTYFSGKALNVSFFYGEDYFLGDLVQFENEYGLGGIALVTEVTMSEDETGFDIYPTFEFID